MCSVRDLRGPPFTAGSIIARTASSNSVTCTMKPKLALSLITYGIVMAVGGLLVYRVNPDATSTTLVAAAAGGGLCCFWGVMSLLANRGRGWAILTLAAVSFTLLTQAVVIWTAPGEFQSGVRWVPLLITFMFGLSVVMLTWLAHAEPMRTRSTDTPA